jgi:hypothetical protein
MLWGRFPVPWCELVSGVSCEAASADSLHSGKQKLCCCRGCLRFIAPGTDSLLTLQERLLIHSSAWPISMSSTQDCSLTGSICNLEPAQHGLQDRGTPSAAAVIASEQQSTARRVLLSLRARVPPVVAGLCATCMFTMWQLATHHLHSFANR